MPASTFRAWVIGILWAIIIPGVNQFFFFRYPSVNITQVRPPSRPLLPRRPLRPAR